MKRTCEFAYVALITLLACSSFAQENAAPDHGPSVCKKIDIEAYPPIKANKIADKAASPEGVVKAPEFSARKMLDLKVSVELRFSGDMPRMFEMRFFGPNGHLYESRFAPFPPEVRDGVPTEGSSTPDQSGADDATPVQADASETAERGKVSPFRRTVTTRLPVAGTFIVLNSLYGTWWVEVYPDGASKPCSTRTFSIGP